MRVAIWDGPTRLFHWLLVLLIAGAWWTAEQGELEWHFRIGTAIGGLLVFRIVWGLIGGSTARFAGFVRGPRAAIDYLRGRAPPAIGHNPLGALSVVAMLGLLCLMVGLGLVSTDEDGLFLPPLSHLVSLETSEAAHDLHEQVFDILLVLIGLHVAAILFHALVRRRNLIGPMVTGTGTAPEGAQPLRRASAIRLIAAILVALAAIWLVWSV